MFGTRRSSRLLAVVLAAGAAAMIACQSEPPPEDAVASDQLDGNLVLASARAGLPPSDISITDMPEPTSDGAKLVAQYCTPCHAMPHPTTHAANDWPVVMRRMWMRTEIVGDDFNIPVPDAAERMAMTRYMLDHALAVAAGDLPDFPGREVFEAQCSRCHALPDPRQHSPSDWATVVTRMSRHMEDLLDDILTHQQIQDLVLYLERASATSE